jgi:hypothetical protein
MAPATPMSTVAGWDQTPRREPGRPSKSRIRVLPDPEEVPAGSQWQLARVLGITRERRGMTCLRLGLPDGAVCDPGADYLLRIPSLDGFTVVRCTSAVPGDPTESSGVLELFAPAPAGSDVAAVLHGVLRPGDVLEVCGPWELFTEPVSKPEALLTSSARWSSPRLLRLSPGRARGR